MNKQHDNELRYKILKMLSENLFSPEEIARGLEVERKVIKFLFREFEEKNMIEIYYADQYTISTTYKKKLINKALQNIYQDVPIVKKQSFDKVKQKNLIETKLRKKNNMQSLDSINIYQTGKSQSKYYRYSFYEGGKIKHLHIKGGNTSNSLVKKRVMSLRTKIASGATHEEIVKIIKSW